MFLVQAGMHLALSVEIEGSVDLVSVMIRIFHADHIFDGMIREKILDIFLFGGKLFFIGNMDVFTSAAFFIKYAVLQSTTSESVCTTLSVSALRTSYD